MAELVPRAAASRLAELVAHPRIVMVGGPRQSGKTTLMRQYQAKAGGSYRTPDQADTLRAALDDPAAFVTYGDPPRVIDEVQRGGDDLVRAIKVAVDADPAARQVRAVGLGLPALGEPFPFFVQAAHLARAQE
jgi:uncharacterized protein